MKLDLNPAELKEFEILSAIKAMTSQQARLLELAAELQVKIKNYTDYMENLKKFNTSVNKDWINKGESPSEFYLNDKEIDFNNGKLT